MLIQRKLLTNKEKNDICKKYEHKACYDCPLKMTFSNGSSFCTVNIDKLEEQIKEFWNEEIEIK